MPESWHNISRRKFIGLVSKGIALTPFFPAVSSWGTIGDMSHVVICHDGRATDGSDISVDVVRDMLDRSVDVFTDGGGWSSLFPTYKSGDKIGIKVSTHINPNLPSHPEVVDAIISGLNGMGVPNDDITVL